MAHEKTKALADQMKAARALRLGVSVVKVQPKAKKKPAR